MCFYIPGHGYFINDLLLVHHTEITANADAISVIMNEKNYMESAEKINYLVYVLNNSKHLLKLKLIKIFYVLFQKSYL